MKLLLPFLLSIVVSRADTNEALSGVFAFDTRDSAGTNESVSGVFSIDARDLGNAASSASSVFALGTQSGTLDALLIGAGAPAAVVAGQPYVFPAQASFAGSGNSIDASASAVWFIVGDAPPGTRFEGNRLIGGNVTVPSVIRVSAAFNFPLSGIREAVPVEVTIHPAPAGYRVDALYSSTGEWRPDLRYWRTVNFNAIPSSSEGPALSQNVSWDLDDEGEFDDATGLTAQRDYRAGQTSRIGVRAEWPQAGGLSRVAINHFYLTLDQPLVANEPLLGRAVDAIPGSFLNDDEESTVPLAARKATGLVILTHGLNDQGTSRWLQDMYRAIETRLGDSPPNVLIYDWREKADPAGDGTRPVSIEHPIDAFNDIVKVREAGRAQGIKIADWIGLQRQLGRVDPAAPVHLIGHSAGGFVVGDCARILSQRGYGKLQATMLDTPLPYQSHIQPGWRTERYISSWIGGNPTEHGQATAWNSGAKLVGSKVDEFLVTGGGEGSGGLYVSTPSVLGPERIRLKAHVPTSPKYYRTTINPHSDDFFEKHSASHEYYTATISSTYLSNYLWGNEVLGDGFNQSLLVRDQDFGPPPQSAPAPAPDGPQPAPPYVPPMDGFSTFGEVEVFGSLYRVLETLNAGILKNLTLPAAAATLQFQVQVTTPGDGDFVSVHWNDGDALAIVPETALAYDAPLLHEVDLIGLGGQTGTLTLKLVSRGEANGVVEFSEIRILEETDLDGDGLLNADEQTAGSDPLEIDSDSDGLTDGEEVHDHATSPMKPDSDRDRQSDADELAAGTNPVDTMSRFTAAISPRTAGAPAAVMWEGVAGRSYRVVRSPELGTFNLDFLQGGIAGIDGPMLFQDENPPEPRAFYWIEVE